MSQSKPRQRKWMVRRTFEPNRLSQAHLEQVYETIVPRAMRVVPIGSSQDARASDPAGRILERRAG